MSKTSRKRESGWDAQALTQHVEHFVSLAHEKTTNTALAMNIELDVSEACINPDVDWPLVDRRLISAKTRAKHNPLVAVGHNYRRGDEPPYSLYVAPWPTTRPDFYMPIVSDIVRLDAAGLEVHHVELRHLLFVSWHEGVMVSLRRALCAAGMSPRVVETLRLCRVKIPFAPIPYVLVWRTETKCHGTCPPRLHSWLNGIRAGSGEPAPYETHACLRKVPCFMSQWQRARAHRVVQGMYLFLDADAPAHFVDRVSVTAVDTESLILCVRTCVIYFDYERPLRDLLYHALALSPRLHALVPMSMNSKETVMEVAWFGLRDAYADPISSVLFHGLEEGVEVGIVNLICDYLGVTPARSTDQ